MQHRHHQPARPSRSRHTRHAAAVLVAAFCLLAAEAWGAGLTLGWNPSTDATVIGYRVYMGAQSGVYTNVVDVGGRTTNEVSGLVMGATYFFAVTAYDAVGLESAFSNEIHYSFLPRAPVLLEPNATLTVPIWFWGSTNGLSFWHVGEGLAWAGFPMTNQMGLFYAPPAGTNWPRLPLGITKGP